MNTQIPKHRQARFRPNTAARSVANRGGAVVSVVCGGSESLWVSCHKAPQTKFLGVSLRKYNT